MKRRNLIIAALSVMIMLIAGCSPETVPVEESTSSYGTVNIRTASGAATRSIHPVIEEPAAYDVEFTSVGEVLWRAPEKMEKVEAAGTISVKNVHVGRYTVTLTGYDRSGAVIMEGTSGEFDVVPEKPTEVEVKLGMITSPEAMGKLEITYDWSALTGPEFTGPLQDTIKAGTICLRVEDAEGLLTDTWTQPAAQTLLPDAAGVTFTMELPARKEPYSLVLELTDKDGMTIDIMSGVQATIRGGLTSKPVEGTAEALILTSNPSYAEGVSIIGRGHRPSLHDPATAADLLLRTYSGAEKLEFRIYDVTEGQRDVYTVQSLPVVTGSYTYRLTGLLEGHTYEVDVNVVYRGGRESGFRSYDKLRGIRALTPVENITIDDEVLVSTIDTKGNFTVKASFTPENPSETDVRWEYDSDLFRAEEGWPLWKHPFHELKLSAGHPGKGTVKVTSLDTTKGTVSDETAEITVKLAAPTGLEAKFSEDFGSVVLTWTPGDEFADIYEVMKNDGEGWKSIASSVSGLTYTDVDILPGKNYSYKVIAKNSSTWSSAEYNSAESNTVTIESKDVNNVSIRVVLPQNGPTASINREFFTVTKDQSVSVSIDGGIKGASVYSWNIDGMVLPEFTGNSAAVTWEDIEKVNELYGASRSHVLTVATDNGVSASYRFASEFYGYVTPSDEISTTAPTLRLPTDWSGEIFVWVDADDMPEVRIKSETRNGGPVPAGTVAVLDQDGMLSIRGWGEVTLEAALADGGRAESTFSFYEKTFETASEVLDAVNRTINTEMKAIDEALSHDWRWGFAGPQQKFSNGTGSFSGGTPYGAGMDSNEGYLNINHSWRDDRIGEMKMTGSSIMIQSNENYLNTNHLIIFGNPLEGDVNRNRVTVTLPGNQGSVTIEYDGLTTENWNAGKYVMSFSDECGSVTAEGHTVGKSAVEFRQDRENGFERIRFY